MEGGAFSLYTAGEESENELAVYKLEGNFKNCIIPSLHHAEHMMQNIQESSIMGFCFCAGEY